MNQGFGELHALTLASKPRKAVLNDPHTSLKDSNALPTHSKAQITKQKKRKKEKKLKFKKLRKRPRTEALALPNNVFKTDESSDNASVGTSSVSNATVASSVPSTAEQENTCTIAKATAAIPQEKPLHSNMAIPTTTTSVPILLREKLLQLVHGLDDEAKAEFAWKYHGRQRKKGGTQFWYDFRPHEKYCADNAFVPLTYCKLLPSDTPKSQLKRKTTAMVLKQGIQGIHFAIGWVELYHLIVEGGVFADDGNAHPALLELNPPPLDPNGRKSPTKGAIVSSEPTHKSRRATRNKQTTVANDSRASDSDNNDDEMPDLALNSKVAPHDVIFGKRFQNHPGNVQLRNLTEEYAFQYAACQDRQEQLDVAQQAQKELQGVRFWKEDGKEASSKEVLHKIWVRFKNQYYYRLNKKNQEAKEKPDYDDDEEDDESNSSSFNESDHDEQIEENGNDDNAKMPDLAVQSKMAPHDVCFGKRLPNHPGNVQFRNLTEEHLDQFAVCQNRQEQLVIAKKVQKQLVGVRFWKENGKEASPTEVLHKIWKRMENRHYYCSQKKNSTSSAVVKNAKQKADASDEEEDESSASLCHSDHDEREENDYDDDASVGSFEFDCGPPDSAFDSPLKRPPAQQDVLFGRGATLARHPGNLQFRAVTEEFASQFDSAMSRPEQYAVAKKVHSQLLSKGVRFWKENGTEASPEEVVGKIWWCWKNKCFRDKHKSKKGSKAVPKKPASKPTPSTLRSKNDDGSDSDDWEFDTEDEGDAKKPARQDLKVVPKKAAAPVLSGWDDDDESDFEFNTEDEEEKSDKQKKPSKKKTEKKKGSVKSTSTTSNDQARPSTPSPPNSPEPYKWANWRPSAPRTPPTQYLIDHYNGAVDV